MPRGFTLVEILAVLTLIGVAASTVAPGLARYRDLAAVVAARERVAGLIAEARARGVGRGGATVRLTATPFEVETSGGGVPLRFERIERDLGVTVDLGARSDVVLTYDALGIGRVASATVHLRRGNVQRSLVVSSFGRVLRR